MTPIENLCAAIERVIIECDLKEALPVVTGAFVGLTVAFAKESGFDIGRQIMIDGGTNRDITIHQPK